MVMLSVFHLVGGNTATKPAIMLAQNGSISVFRRLIDRISESFRNKSYDFLLWQFLSRPKDGEPLSLNDYLQFLVRFGIKCALGGLRESLEYAAFYQPIYYDVRPESLALLKAQSDDISFQRGAVLTKAIMLAERDSLLSYSVTVAIVLLMVSNREKLL